MGDECQMWRLDSPTFLNPGGAVTKRPRYPNLELFLRGFEAFGIDSLIDKGLSF
jgi:hypothetical protein